MAGEVINPLLGSTKGVEEFKRLFGEPVELDPELSETLTEVSSGLMMVKHPLVNTLYSPGLDSVLNNQLKVKRAAITEVEETQQWRHFIFLHERPWRLDALLVIAERMDDADFWQMVGEVWIDSENIVELSEEWDEVLHTDRPEREAIMDEDERCELADLSDEITIYQGHTDERTDGWSWTTSWEVAEWFARRFSTMEKAGARLTTAKVKRDDVTAYFLGRGEYEILTAPETVTEMKTERV